MLYLHGLGHFHPENVIDNKFLENLDIDTDNEWIVERVGIKTRRTVLNLDYIKETHNLEPRAAHEASVYTNGQTSAYAAKLAMKRAKIKPSDVGLVIAGGCSPQFSIPAEACRVAAECGITAPAIDISSACSSFAAQIDFLARMDVRSMPDYILIVNPENNTRVIDYSDRSSAVLWGDATTAAIVSKAHTAKTKVSYHYILSDPKGWETVIVPVGGHFWQKGSAVQAFAIRKACAGFKEIAARVEEPGHLKFIGHQANLMMLSSVCRRCSIVEENHLHNIVEFGNCGAAGAPSVLSQHWDQMQSGEQYAMVVVGSGLTWGGVLIEVSE